MKRGMAFAVVFLSTLIGASADTFYGSITQTITSTNDSLYQVGQTFTGYYSYESSCADGTFDGFASWRPDLSDNTTLNGSVYMPFAKDAYFDFYMGGSGNHVVYDLHDGPGGSYNALRNTGNHPGSLVITNGCVTDFVWGFELGGFYMQTTETEFNALSFYDRGTGGPKTTGTIVMGNPVCVPESVATFPLVAAALLGLGLFRRRLAR